MDRRGRFGWSSWGAQPGPLSPYTSELGPDGQPPNVRDDDFSYITSSDLETQGYDPAYQYNDPRAYGGHHQHVPQPAAPLDPSLDIPDDDIILLRHRGTTYPEHFPAYSIGDGKLLVEDIRDRVQLVMKLSDRRRDQVRLLYKGKLLKDDNEAACNYGVKNKSEIMIVVPDEDGEVDENASETSDEIIVEEPQGGKRRKSKGKKGKRKSTSPRDSNSGVNLTVPHAGEDKRPSASANRGQSPAPSVGTGVSSSAAPGSPMDTLNKIAVNFRENLLPLCQKFVASPPADAKKRVEEHRKITETVLQQVILKLDAVEHGGDEEIRLKRKDLIRETQEWLNQMDALK